MLRRPLLVANWKMHKTVSESLAYARELIRRLEATSRPHDGREVVICPSALSLWPLAQRLRGVAVTLGAQHLDLGDEGAMTGALSGYLLRHAGASYVIVGHSERRQHFGETDATVASHVQEAFRRRLTPILCVGENAEENRSGVTRDVIRRQVGVVLDALTADDVARLVVAYEPVWAIGSGRVPTAGEASEIARFIRGLAREAFSPEVGESLRVLYGGSVSVTNLGEFWSQEAIDGALVGGAALEVEEFFRMATWGQEG